MMTAAQCRAARALLKWSQRELAERSGVGVTTIRTFETDVTAPYESTIEILHDTFEAAGIEFLTRDGRGVGVQFRSGYGEA